MVVDDNGGPPTHKHTHYHHHHIMIMDGMYGIIKSPNHPPTLPRPSWSLSMAARMGAMPEPAASSSTKFTPGRRGGVCWVSFVG